jgi:hypothetical protein
LYFYINCLNVNKKIDSFFLLFVLFINTRLKKIGNMPPLVSNLSIFLPLIRFLLARKSLQRFFCHIGYYYLDSSLFFLYIVNMKTFIFLTIVTIAIIFVSILTRFIMFSIFNPKNSFKDNLKNAVSNGEEETYDGRTSEGNYYVF